MLTRRRILIALAPLLAACGLTAAQWGGIVASGIKLACNEAVTFVPPTDAAITAKVCKGIDLGADTLENIITAAAGDAHAAHLIQPQGEVQPQPQALTCAGKAVAVMPASYAATLAQRRLDARAECR